MKRHPAYLVKLVLADLLLSTIFALFFCGIYRHDVAKRKFLELGAASQFNCVGHVYLNEKSWGSCVLIDKKYVLTAAHLFVKKGNRIGEDNAFMFEYDGKKYQAAEIFVHPGFLKESKDANDIAIVRLNEEVRNVVPAILNTAFNELKMEVTIVGYGANQPSLPTDGQVAYGEKIAGKNVIDSLCGLEIDGQAAKLACDFDSPLNRASSVMGSDTTLPLEYMVNGGDSGGGAFFNVNGNWLLVGICAHISVQVQQQNGYYGSVCFFTRVAAYSKWIADDMHPTVK